LLNEMDKLESITKEDYRTILHLLNPMAPHITEELNEICELGEEFAKSSWPTYREDMLIESTIEIGVQVNGKLRGAITIEKDMDKEKVLEIAKENENVKKNIEGKTIVKEIVVPNKIVNIVVK